MCFCTSRIPHSREITNKHQDHLESTKPILYFLYFSMKIALLGCGEVGSCYGRAWTAAGHHIIGICELRDDEAMRARAASLNAALHAAPGPWLAEADIVVSAVYGHSASAVAQACLAFLRADAVYADFTASAADMQAAGAARAWAGLHGRGHHGRHRPAGRAHAAAVRRPGRGPGDRAGRQRRRAGPRHRRRARRRRAARCCAAS